MRLGKVCTVYNMYKVSRVSRTVVSIAVAKDGGEDLGSPFKKGTSQSDDHAKLVVLRSVWQKCLESAG